MADSTENSTKQQEEDRTQSSIDSSFFEQMGGPAGVSPSALGYDVTTQVIQSYFENIRQSAQEREFHLRRQVDQAERMAGLWAQGLILQQTTQQVAQAVAPVVSKQVISYLRQNPEWAKQLVQQEIRTTR